MSSRDQTTLTQCSPKSDFPKGNCLTEVKSDVLLDNFRTDISCEVLQKFKEHGVELPELRALAKLIPVVFPWNKEYDTLRYNVNRRFVFFPMMIVMAKTRKDVIYAFRWALDKGIHVVPRGGGHCFESYSLTNGIIIDQSRRNRIKISDCKTMAIVEAGSLIGPTQKLLACYDLGLVGGTCPNVGISGLSLGGGIGFLIRKYGLSLDNLLEIKVLLANGELVRANCEENSNLFWACRGAGNGNYGIVTEFIFKVHCIKDVCVFDLCFPVERLQEVSKVWFKWAPNTVDELSSELDVYRDRVQITGQYLGDECELSELLRPVMNLKPISGKINKLPFIDAVRKFAGKGHWFPFFENKSGFVRKPFPKQAIKIIQKYIAKAGPEDHVELNAFGGAVSRIGSSETAFPHRNVLAWCHLQCHFSCQTQLQEKMTWINCFYEELSPYLYGAYINAPDRDLKDPLDKYYGRNLPRLKCIKQEYDPCNVFHYLQSIKA